VERIRADYPLSLHGVGLSLGSTDPLDTFHLVVHRFQVALIIVRVPSEEIVEWIE
jgi:hypothetical protein